MPENDEFEWIPHSTWVVKDALAITWLTGPAGDRCAEMVLRSMRAKSKRERENYLTVAQFYALAAETQ